MSSRAEIALLGWVPAVVLLFLFLKPRRAVVASAIAGLLFLPETGWRIPGFVDYTKTEAISLALLIGVLLRDRARFARLHFIWLDVLVAVWCISPMISSMANGLGAYDGISGIWKHIMMWGAPYLIGRMYFDSKEGLRDLALGFFIGGLVYIPLCVFEMRMSPTLCNRVYGFRASPFHATKRLGGYRPVVFLHSGLELGLYMSAATCAGLWLWRAARLERVGIAPAWLCSVALTAITLLCRSLNALFLLFVSVISLTHSRASKRAILLLVFALWPSVYISLRMLGVGDVDLASNLVRLIDDQRAMSFEFRIRNEELFLKKAWEQPVFGWGRWGRNRMYNEDGKDLTIADGYWAVVFGQNGIFGLVALYSILAIPTVLVLRRLGPRRLVEPAWAGATAMCAIVSIYAADSLMNAMLSPPYHLAIGGLAGLASRLTEPEATPRRARYRLVRVEPAPGPTSRG